MYQQRTGHYKTKKKNILPQLKDYCIKNNISKKDISIKDLRQILKELKLDKYYKYTSYFYKELTGNELPFISHDIINRAKWYFKQIYRAREKLVEKGKLPKNNLQYFYFIYKIFDLILEEDKSILQFIHLPSEDILLIKNLKWNVLASSNIILMDYYKFTKQSFDHNKHFENCINNVLGIIKPKKGILPQLKDYCTKNNISKKHISINDLRQILKQLKLDKYYKYTSYFYKELTGNELPFISHDIINRAKWYFKQFYRAREKLIEEGKLPKK